MKISLLFLSLVFTLCVFAQPSFSRSDKYADSQVSGRIATSEDLLLLKKDILEGKIKIGTTRLNDIRRMYGDAPSIKETSKKITYNYKDLRIDFDKNAYFRDWEYDYSHPYAFKDEIDDLRYDLQDYQIVGDYNSFAQFVKDYDDPTEAFPKKGDGAYSVYYWGELKLIFENVIVVSSLQGSKLDEVDTSGVLGAGIKSE